MTKICNQCELPKDVEEFHRQNRNKDGRQSICKTCRKELDREWYKTNPTKREGNEEYGRRLLEEMRSIKVAAGCSFCPENEAVCLEFHHTDDNKEHDVAELVKQHNRQKMLDEIAKCIVICSNCHRKLHAGIIPANKQVTGSIPAASASRELSLDWQRQTNRQLDSA